MHTKKRILSAATAFALVGGAAVTTALPSGAVEQDIIFALQSGQVDIAGTILDLPNGDPEGEGTTAFVGTWDDASGAVIGTLDVPPMVLEVTDPAAVTVDVTMTQAGDGTGTIDPATGIGSITVTTNTHLQARGDLSPLVNCNVGPVTMVLDAVVDLEADPRTISLTSTGFEVPAVSDCAGGAAINDLVNGALGIQGAGTTATSADLTFLQTNELPAPPTTTTTTTAAPTTTTTAAATPAPVARPTAATPRYTG